MEQIRLDKYLGEMGQGTRSQIKEAARKGRVCVNGVTVKKSDRKINPDQDCVTMDGKVIAYARYEYYMLNKPQGVVSATEDVRHETVVSLIGDRLRNDLFPVGRLDIDTEGLLLLTNDGELAHNLLSPKKHVDKVYYVKADGRLPENAQKRFSEGIILNDGTKTLPAGIEILSQDTQSCEILLTIREGKFHQVKRMLEALDCNVTYLKRLSMGTLSLDERLAPGEYRPLTQEELDNLRR